ncbi:YrvL family regulatory protein [Priestia sp. SB1]|uniref:YrvL family regulatory protein n=1 Tax=Priestia aryabhattai TaxID=412384 RepID=A0AAX6NDP3_PRIAR|nr:YrvL family regulatory protein [Priestia aryabhattai]MDU9694043.1 YrvL family regulatory protein [Priestia aryabhattai]
MFNINKVKTIVICLSIVLIILFAIMFFEFFTLKLLGLQYDSIGSLVYFFVLYLLLEIPLSLIVSAIPKALKSVGIIQSSKGLLSFLLDTGLTFAIINLLDIFMTHIKMEWLGAILFSIIAGFISSKLKEKDEEPPLIDSEEFKEIEKGFELRK